MKQLSQFINEAKATYCGRCGTTHVSPAKGGTCPALKEEDMPWHEDPKNPTRKVGVRKDQYGNVIKDKNLAKHLAKKAMQTNEEAEQVDETAMISAQINSLMQKKNATASPIARKNIESQIAKLRKQKTKMAEEAEQIDELSTKALEKYRNVARADAYDADEVDDDRRFRKRAGGITKANKAIRKNFVKGVDEEVEQVDEVSAAKLRDYTAKASDARGHRNLPTAKLDKRYKSMALAHEKIRARHAQVAATEETAKTLSQFIEEAVMNEAHDIELKPHSNGTHYIVHKIHPSSGIEKDQLKVGEKIHDTHVDDLHDMGYSVKIHKK